MMYSPASSEGQAHAPMKAVLRAVCVLECVMTGLCLMTAATSLLSLRWHIKWTCTTRETDVGLNFAAVYFERVESPANIEWSRKPRGFSLLRGSHSPRHAWLPRVWTLTSAVPTKLAARAMDVPMWIPLIVFVLSSGALCYRDGRRRPPNYCGKYGYDVTGNVLGRCPECGTPVGGHLADRFAKRYGRGLLRGPVGA
jgi:hypothetical protein